MHTGTGMMAVAALLAVLAPAAAVAQVRYDYSPRGFYQGYTERQGGTYRYYDRSGDYQGSAERSAGGGVRRYYDADGRYLGREDINRDFRARRPPEPDALPAPRDRRYDPAPRDRLYDPAPRSTPWFGDGAR